MFQWHRIVKIRSKIKSKEHQLENNFNSSRVTKNEDSLKKIDEKTEWLRTSPKLFLFGQIFIVVVIFVVMMFVVVVIRIFLARIWRLVVTTNGRQKSGRLVSNNKQELSLEGHREPARVFCVSSGRFRNFFVRCFSDQPEVCQLLEGGDRQSSVSVDSGKIGRFPLERILHAERNQGLKSRC